VLLKHRADVDAEAEGGGTALRWATKNGHEATVRVLLEHRADVDAKAKGGRDGAAPGGREGGHKARWRCWSTDQRPTRRLSKGGP
jgi:ankyrin repeat protein